MSGLGNTVQQHNAPRAGFDQGEHGAGIGVSGGHGIADASNTQSGGVGDSFNQGIGGEHASGGLSRHGETPIADRFSSQTGGANNAGSGTLDAYASTGTTGHQHEGHHHHHHHGHSHEQGVSSGLGKYDNALDYNSRAAAGAGAGIGLGAVSGAYSGSGTSDALTGQSGAHTTGRGVGFGGENLSGGQNLDSGISSATSRSVQTRETGIGAGQFGGSGGHYSTGTGTTGGADAAATAPVTDRLGAGTGAGATSSGANDVDDGKTRGRFGTVDDHPRGEPISDPSEIDTGGPHSLVFHEGKYVHRRDLDGQGSTGVQHAHSTEKGTGVANTDNTTGTTGSAGTHGTTQGDVHPASQGTGATGIQGNHATGSFSTTSTGTGYAGSRDAL